MGTNAPKNTLAELMIEQGGIPEETPPESFLPVEPVPPAPSPSEKPSPRPKPLPEKLNGIIERLDREGRLQSRMTYKDGILEGPYELYNQGFLLLKGTYQNGKKEGVEEGFASNGVVILKRMYQDGSLNGPMTIYMPPQGQKIQECKYIQGLLEGPFIRYYPSGTVMLEASYKGGLLEGPSTSFYPDGKVQVHAIYAAGRIVGEEEKFSPRGRRIKN